MRKERKRPEKTMERLNRMGKTSQRLEIPFETHQKLKVLYEERYPFLTSQSKLVSEIIVKLLEQEAPWIIIDPLLLPNKG